MRAQGEGFIQQAAQAQAEAQMQAMADEGQRKASMCQAASERYADADVREHDPTCKEEQEMLKRKQQEEFSRSISESNSLLMTWSEHLLQPMP